MNYCLRSLLVLCTLFTSVLQAGSFKFQLVVIDNNYNNGAKPGWSRLGDMDQDGFIDVVAGGGNYIGWYKNPSWTKVPTWEKYVIGTAGCNGGVLFDVDRDGDLDVIASVKNEKHQSFWFENPYRGHPKSENKENWTRRIIDFSTDLTFQHDLEIGDIDMDGVPDDFVVLHDNYRTKTAIIKWYKLPKDPKTQKWELHTIAKGTVGGVGIAIGDIDADGKNDVVRGGKWYEAPQPATGNWREHLITATHLTNVRLRDLDYDGDLDIIAAAGWDDKGVIMWMENKDKGKNFVVHHIATLYHPENMVVLDLDGDGNYEVITGEMKGEDDSNFLVFENKNVKNDKSWKKHVISNTNGICARMNVLDVDADGDMDIVCDGNAQSHIYLWINQSKRAASTDLVFKFFNLDNTYAPGWIRAGDMDNDGDLDIVSGGGKKLYIYENNGKARGWKRHGSLEHDVQPPMGCNAAVLFDVDRDGFLDVIASRKRVSLGWWKNPGGKLKSKLWTYHLYHPVDGYYLHDMIKVDLDQDGLAEEFITNTNKGYWKGAIKIRWFKISGDPTQFWEVHEIEPGRVETFHGHAGFDFGDINGDGHNDVAYSNGWYEGSGDPKDKWIWHEVTQIYGISNNLIRDIDGDGDMDLVMSAGHHGTGAYWFENSGDPNNGPWKQHTIDALVHNPEGLQAVDIDEDGDIDIVAAELFFGEAPQEPDWSDDAHNVYLYRNLGGNPARWEKINIAPNTRPCHSLRVVDINQDGKLDIIAESSGAPGVIYIENIGEK